ncbi:hypothetical protein [Ramlibacter sp. AN1133]|uniref:hypothetical protein n=1 Tax=Ramlibacter sp. AN1133 TaxID=3133429 RepID=UPI0030C5DE47
MTQLRVGFASVYAWRPHVEHMMFLARLVEQAGHAAFFLACDADLPSCYTRELRDVRPDWMECLLCRAGGVRSYTGRNVAAIGSLVAAPDADALARGAEWAASSASTLGRFESPADYASPEFAQLRDRLAPGAAIAYEAAKAWIRRERLDAICLFNGRMDATRGIFEAARAAGVRVVTFERTWFGDGIQLLPDEHCLGLATWHATIARWSTVPLSQAQARKAAAFVAARLTRTNASEWRAYNVDARDTGWPVAGGKRRILVLPSSLNEIWNMPGWESPWGDATAGFDAVMAHLGLQPEDLVLRCHPNWSERIGKRDGRLPEAHYTAWARSRGIHVIGSADKASTMSLIAHCDAVLLASGSAALEAAAMGKQVISIGPSHYQEAGLRTDATTPSALAGVSLDVDLPPQERAAAQDRLRRAVLRFLYTVAWRLPQYVQHVKAVSTTSYRYVPGADPHRLVDLLRTGRLEADDACASPDAAGEDRVVALLQSGEWESLRQPAAEGPAASDRLRRRWFLQPVDFIREKMPVGDR